MFMAMPFRPHHGSESWHILPPVLTEAIGGRRHADDQKACDGRQKGASEIQDLRQEDRRDAVENRCEAKTDQQGTALWRIAEQMPIQSEPPPRRLKPARLADGLGLE
jgi:hypothetical protein